MWVGALILDDFHHVLDEHIEDRVVDCCETPNPFEGLIRSLDLEEFRVPLTVVGDNDIGEVLVRLHVLLEQRFQFFQVTLH